MASINSIILNGLKSYFDENSDIPQEMRQLIEDLLKFETHENISKEGIDKLYEQVLEKYLSNDSFNYNGVKKICQLARNASL